MLRRIVPSEVNLAQLVNEMHSINYFSFDGSSNVEAMSSTTPSRTLHLEKRTARESGERHEEGNKKMGLHHPFPCSA